MPDTKQVGLLDRRTGGGGLAAGLSPTLAQKNQFAQLINSYCDVPGLASSRRGLQNLDHTQAYTLVSGVTNAYKPQKAWCFDNNLFLYLEDSSNHCAIVAYDMLAQLWQIVYSAAQPKLSMDSGIRKVFAKAFDRTCLILCDGGVKRLSALYGASSTSQYNYVTALRPAGVPRGLDPRCRNAVAGGGTDHGFVATPNYNWLTDPNNTGKAAVAYRVCWVYRDENGILISGAPSGRIVVRNTTGTAYSTRLKVVIPPGLTGRYVMQVYRTNVMPQDGTGSIPDPGDDMFLAGEYQLTTADLSNGYLLYLDISFDGILGDELYTNFAQEGPDQARFQPPMARTIERFGNCAWYGDITDRQRLTVKILAVDSSGIGTFPGIRVGDHLIFGDIAMEGVAPATEDTANWYFAVDNTTGSGSEIIRVLKTTESIVYKYNLISNAIGGKFSAYNLTSGDDIVGVIGFEEKAIAGSTFYMGADRIDSPTAILPSPGMPVSGSYTNASKITVTTNAGATVATVTYAGLSVNPAVGDKFIVVPYGLSNSLGATSPKFAATKIPSGEYTLTTINIGLTQFTFSIAGLGCTALATDVNDATHGGFCFETYSSAALQGTNARSQASRVKNRVCWSSPGEFECAPIVNFKDFGNADCKVQSIIATVSSLFILKEDGIWRGRGTDGEWQFEYLDPACHVIAPTSPAVVAGDVYAYSNNGVVRISESGVTKISTEISILTDTFQRTINADPAMAVLIDGVASNEDQAYLLSMPSAAGAAGAYNIFRYHAPSKHWSQHTYSDISSAPGTYTIGSICMANATRYQAGADPQAYIERLVVAHNSVAVSVGIERRDGTFIEFCEWDVGYQPITSYNSSNNTILLSTPPPSCVRPGDVFWAQNASKDRTYRAPITAINGSTITVDIEGQMTPLSSWPAVGTVTAVIMRAFPIVVTPTTSLVSDGFSNTHMSDVYVQMGNNGMFTNLTMTYSTDLMSSVGTSTITGSGAKNWTTLGSGYARDGLLTTLQSFNFVVPQNAQRGASMSVTISNLHAWEPFDLSGIQISMYGEAKIRRTI